MQTRKITYLYRDAGNYKFWNEFFVYGELSLSELRPYLLDGEFFLPEQIGLRSLVPEMKNEDDHLLHEFYDVEDSEMTFCEMTAEQLIERMRKANRKGWF